MTTKTQKIQALQQMTWENKDGKSKRLTKKQATELLTNKVVVVEDERLRHHSIHLNNGW